MSIFQKAVDKIIPSKIDLKYEIKFSMIYFGISVVLEVLLAMIGNSENILIRGIKTATFGMNKIDVQSAALGLLLNPLHLLNMLISTFIFSKFFLIRWLDSINKFGGSFLYLVIKCVIVFFANAIVSYALRDLYNINGNVYGLLPGTSKVMVVTLAFVWIIIINFPLFTSTKEDEED